MGIGSGFSLRVAERRALSAQKALISRPRERPEDARNRAVWKR
jgi:hypothetical protein